MNPVSKDIMELLVKGGKGEFASQDDWGIFRVSEPPEPDNCITIFDVAGSSRNPSNLNKTVETATFQIRVRGTDYDLVYGKAEELRIYLHRYTNRNGKFRANDDKTRYDNILWTTGPFPLKKDDSNRFLVTVNFDAYREEFNTDTGD